MKSSTFSYGTENLPGFVDGLVAQNLAGVLAACEPEPVRQGAEMETAILACSESVKAMAWNFVRGSASRLDVDDLYSIGMLAVCNVAHRFQMGLPPKGYLCRSAKNAMIDACRREGRLSLESLDAPLSHDPDLTLTLVDIIPVPGPVVQSRRQSHRTRVLDQAIRRLSSAKQRAVVRRRYGLPGYGLAESRKQIATQLRTSESAVDSANLSALRNLAGDARLRVAVGAEVQR